MARSYLYVPNEKPSLSRKAVIFADDFLVSVVPIFARVFYLLVVGRWNMAGALCARRRDA